LKFRILLGFLTISKIFLFVEKKYLNSDVEYVWLGRRIIAGVVGEDKNLLNQLGIINLEDKIN
jgi:hypothetical protein